MKAYTRRKKKENRQERIVCLMSNIENYRLRMLAWVSGVFPSATGPVCVCVLVGTNYY